jgi:hexosaminidase
VAALLVAVGGCTSHGSAGGRGGPLSPLPVGSASSSVAASPPPSTSPTSTPPLPTPGPASQSGAIAASLVPLPVLASTDEAASFTLTAATAIAVGHGDGVRAVADDLAALLRPATGFPLRVTAESTAARPDDSIVLRLDGDDATLGDEGYSLAISQAGVDISANAAAGLFHGVQTLRQLLPASIEAKHVSSGPWRVIGGRIVDYPRFAYRGAMLDVTRHFFPVADVERYIDELALYKVNMLHLHLSDDQGWRIAIDAWPNLAAHGGLSEVGNRNGGGYYTKADYTAIVRYAQARFITVVPEIDTPGHTTAALSSYPELNCSGVAPPLYIGEQVGFSSLCVDKPVTYEFLDDVVGELAALTPGPYIHLGGDEAQSTAASDYVKYVQKAAQIVAAHGKHLMGWAEISAAKLDPGSVAEYWNFNDRGVSEQAAVAQGVQVVSAPANHAYLDQKYDNLTTLGLNWAGYNSVENAYAWDPLDGGRISEANLLGVEAPLWSETLRTMADVEYMAWPRLAGIAEIGWTPQAERSWSTYAPRLAQQSPRWTAMGMNFFRSPQVAWAS